MNEETKKLMEQAQYYTPSKSVTLDASGGADPSATIKFTGLNSRRYGVNRFLPGGTNLNEVTATIAFNNNRDKKFEDIQLSTLRAMFLNRSLRGAFEIGDSTEVFVTLTNHSNAEQTVNFQLIGYDDYQLEAKQMQYRDNNVKFPEPEFVYLPFEEVASGATDSRISVELPAYKLRLYRIAMGSTDTGDNLRVSFRQDQIRIKPEVFLAQVNDEFSNMDIILPITLEAYKPFDIFVTNADGVNPYSISLLAECYRI